MGKQVSVKERLFARYVAEGRTQPELCRYQGEHHRGKASRLYVEQQLVAKADMDSPTVILERLNGLLSRESD